MIIRDPARIDRSQQGRVARGDADRWMTANGEFVRARSARNTGARIEPGATPSSDNTWSSAENRQVDTTETPIAGTPGETVQGLKVLCSAS